MPNLLRPAVASVVALLTLSCSAPWNHAPAPSVPAAAPTAPVTQPAPQPAPPTSSPIGSDGGAIFNGNATELVAYDAATHRAFVANVAEARVDILDLTDAAAPVIIGTIDVTPYGQNPTSVAVYNGIVAIAVEANKKTADGTVLLANADGSILTDVRVGALPAAVAFTPDGTRLVVANKGEANKEYTRNPEGSISIIDLRAGADKVGKKDVRTAGFTQFNEATLDPRIRILGPDASVAQDLEPGAIAIDSDGRTAHVTLQKNNASAVVDLDAAVVTALLALSEVDSSLPAVLGLHDLAFADLPVAGTTAAGQPLTLGGFSALTFEGVDAATGTLTFVTITDRGPNASPADVNDGIEARPFALPDFTPRLVRFAVDPAAGAAQVTSEILLTNVDGAPLTGLPNLDGEPGRANSDERAIDLRGNPLPFDPMGIDPEGLAVAADGSYWVVEEYRPSILHFDAGGRLIRRYVPEGANANPAGVTVGVEALPAVLMQRRVNRGFEAAVLDGEILYIFMQSPIDNPDRANDANAKASNVVRIIAFDTVAEQTVGQYIYLLDGGNVDKLGDAVALGNGAFLVLERDDLLGPTAQKYVYRISLEGATNLEDVRETAAVGVNQGLEMQSLVEMALAGVRPVRKQLYVDLTAAGYTQTDKPEGLALVEGNRLALINDDDFGMSGAFDPATGLFTYNPAAVPSLLTLIDLKPAGPDASDAIERIAARLPPEEFNADSVDNAMDRCGDAVRRGLAAATATG